MNELRTQQTNCGYLPIAVSDENYVVCCCAILTDHAAVTAEARQSCRTARQLPGTRSVVTLTEPGQTTGRTVTLCCSTERRAAAAAVTVSAACGSNSSDGDFGWLEYQCANCASLSCYECFSHTEPNHRLSLSAASRR